VKLAVWLAGVFLLSSVAFAHHSEAGIDMDTLLEFDAIVTEYSWRNPHVYFTAETVNEDGETAEWVLQLGSTITSGRSGWSQATLATGDRIQARVHPAQDGRTYGILESLQKGGQRISGTRRYAAQETVATTTLEGRWMADGSLLAAYRGGYDGFFDSQLQLTAKAIAARGSYDSLSDQNPDATCVGRPTPALIVSSGLYPIEFNFLDDDILAIRSESFDEERIVYMDGRSHPSEEMQFHAGHSIGRWDGDTLVVDTANFSFNRSPYQIGVPAGPQKQVTERYRLLEGGTRVAVEFLLEDPEYLVEPLQHSRELIYTPHLPRSRFDCDPNTTRRFVPS